MPNTSALYIDGAWVAPHGDGRISVVNPATEEIICEVVLGDESDVDLAVSAARRAFESYSRWSVKDRIDLMRSIVAAYEKRGEEIAQTVSAEMGSPIGFSRAFHVPGPPERFEQMARLLTSYRFEQSVGRSRVVREPIGVCGLITPWNVPVGQIASKLAPALAAGCTVVVKPSEFAPLSPLIFAEVLHDAGVPPGVFNLVIGDGPTVGQRIAAHPDIDMVTFTGSTRTGIAVAQAAAVTIKRVQQELGGKSPNIILPDADLARWVEYGVRRCYNGSGQSCQAPTRMLVHADSHDQALAVAKLTAESFAVGDPLDEATTMGPVAHRAQYEKVQGLIEAGVNEGATLVTGGPGRPAGLDRGFFVKPTVFGNVRRDMRIAREEIFGPVLSILPYADEADALAIANDTPYGLAAWVCSDDTGHARAVADRLRTGRVYINGAPQDVDAPFGGYKQSGNGREGGLFGLEAYLETKALIGIA